MTRCNFTPAWVGPCGKSDCKEHTALKCSCCGAPATRECSETFGLVCGAPLCLDCEHELTEDGVNFAGNRHVRKDNQKYTHWIEHIPAPETAE